MSPCLRYPSANYFESINHPLWSFVVVVIVCFLMISADSALRVLYINDVCVNLCGWQTFQGAYNCVYRVWVRRRACV